MLSGVYKFGFLIAPLLGESRSRLVPDIIGPSRIQGATAVGTPRTKPKLFFLLILRKNPTAAMAWPRYGSIAVPIFQKRIALVLGAVCITSVGIAAEFSTIDGSLNNPGDSTAGQAGQRFSRKLNMAFYSDGISEIDETLANARLVSNHIFGQGPFSYNNAKVAFMAAAWGKTAMFSLLVLFHLCAAARFSIL